MARRLVALRSSKMGSSEFGEAYAGTPAEAIAKGLLAYLESFVGSKGTVLEALDPREYRAKCVGESPV
eukprot:1982955-Alexandrium_andersonii.AAC.1